MGNLGPNQLSRAGVEQAGGINYFSWTFEARQGINIGGGGHGPSGPPLTPSLAHHINFLHGYVNSSIQKSQNTKACARLKNQQRNHSAQVVVYNLGSVDLLSHFVISHYTFKWSVKLNQKLSWESFCKIISSSINS